MCDGILNFEHGRVTLGVHEIDGILVNQSVRGMVRFDEAKADGASGKVKVPLGWEDADITLAMDLLTDGAGSCYDKLAALNGIFMGHDNGANPNVYEIVNAHVTARGIHQVVFAGLDSSESDRDDVIGVSLHFVEHNPPVRDAERRAQGTDNGTPVAPGEPAADDALMADSISVDVG